MAASFITAEKATHRKIVLVGLFFCALFVAVTFFAKEQPVNHDVMHKADKFVRTAGSPQRAN